MRSAGKGRRVSPPKLLSGFDKLGRRINVETLHLGVQVVGRNKITELLGIGYKTIGFSLVRVIAFLEHFRPVNAASWQTPQTGFFGS